ncbi:hypothetical protein L218DRAFT_577636 [Marasmius fiardii PR-910]|nr:hypothetical protein L218DRAFT_577636 [Marasmius fiardii PR-910]
MRYQLAVFYGWLRRIIDNSFAVDVPPFKINSILKKFPELASTLLPSFTSRVTIFPLICIAPLLFPLSSVFSLREQDPKDLRRIDMSVHVRQSCRSRRYGLGGYEGRDANVRVDPGEGDKPRQLTHSSKPAFVALDASIVESSRTVCSEVTHGEAAME